MNEAFSSRSSPIDFIAASRELTSATAARAADRDGMRRDADASLLIELLELRAECRLARYGDMFVVLLPD
ncbi:hypothetical protein [Bradyrhizobium niftali]|uniref:hypothetical protein n=1 Tax=Bradyrhizobium niftali TaxID=2560055 RepID=UPI00384F3501